MTRIEDPSTESRTAQARVFVDGRPIDIRSSDPTVADVLRKAGYNPDLMEAFLLKDANDPRGEKIPMQTVLHLKDRQEPVYLRCAPKKKDERELANAVGIAMTSHPDEEQRGIGIPDLRNPAGPAPPPEPPGPPPFP